MNPNFTSNPAKTVLTISTGLIVIYLYLVYRGTSVDGLLYAASFLGLIGILSDFLSKKIEWVWMKLSWVLSLIIPNIILTIVFFLVLFPIAIVARILKRGDLLMLKKHYNSTFIEVNNLAKPSSFKNPW